MVDQPEFGTANGLAPDIAHLLNNADCLYSQREISFALDQLAVTLTVHYQDQNPLCIVLKDRSNVFAGMLMQRMVFPLDLAFVPNWEQFELERCSSRQVLLLDALVSSSGYEDIKRQLYSAGATSVALVALVSLVAKVQPTAEQDALPDVAPSQLADFSAVVTPTPALLGCGLNQSGYGANLPGIYRMPDAPS